MRIGTCALGLALSLSITPALAQSADPGQSSERALKLAYEGDDLYARGRWAEAYDRFAAADDLTHSPVFVLYMARCRKNASHLLEARRLYESVMHERPGPLAPKPFREALSAAAQELLEVNARIPVIRVIVTGAPDGPLAVGIDGKTLSDVAAPTDVDPGIHRVDASSGSTTIHKEVTLLEAAAPVLVELTFARRETPVRTRGSLVPTIAAFAASAVGIGVGSASGLIAASKSNSIKGDCIDGHCLRADADTLASAKTFATASTIGFLVGGVGIAGAGVLFFTRSHGSAEPAARVSVGPSSVFLDGSF